MAPPTLISRATAARLARAARLLSACVLPVALAACDAPASPPVLLSETCSVDTPARGSVVKHGTSMHVGGWAFDRRSGVAPEDVKVQLVSADQRSMSVFKAQRGTLRPDVVKVFDAPGAEKSGFDLVVETARLPRGRHTIYVLQQAKDASLLCAADYHFVLG